MFYLRRAFRLYPALAVVCAAVLVTSVVEGSDPAARDAAQALVDDCHFWRLRLLLRGVRPLASRAQELGDRRTVYAAPDMRMGEILIACAFGLVGVLKLVAHALLNRRIAISASSYTATLGFSVVALATTFVIASIRLAPGASVHGQALRVLMMATAILAAELSYRFVEQPFLRLRDRSPVAQRSRWRRAARLRHI